jgi:hypothetical protein
MCRAVAHACGQDGEVESLFVDPDGPTSWPTSITSIVRSAGGRDVDSLPWGHDADTKLRDALGGTPLLAYHATRLLPHEEEQIRGHGLRLLTEDLIAHRLTAAVEHGYFEDEVAQQLLHGNALRSRRDDRRQDQICFFVGTSVLVEHPHAVRPLLKTWGGEGINFTEAAQPLTDRLRSIGRPVILVVALPHTAQAQMVTYPSLTSVFSGAYQGAPRSADLFWREGDIPGECVAALWTTGSPEYDRFSSLQPS